MSKKISQFDAITTRNNDDWLLIEEASTGAYKKIKVSDFIANLSSSTSEPSSSFPVVTRLNFSASKISGLSDNALVDSIPDSSGNQFTGTATGTSRPIYKTNVLNGKSALYFTGSQWVDWNGYQIIPEVGNFVIFQVASYQQYGEVCGFGSGGNTGDTWGIQVRGEIHYAVTASTLRECNFPDPPLNTSHISNPKETVVVSILYQM